MQNFKRTLTTVAATVMAIGTFAPMAFASTTSTKYTNDGTKPFVVNGQTLSNPYVLDAKDSGNTTAFLGMYYFDQALTALGATATWDGINHVWAISSPSIDASKISIPGGVGTGNTTITVNGTVVKKINTFAAKDPAGSVMTTYFPAFYVNELFTAFGFDASWDGVQGLAIKSTYKSGVTGFVTDAGKPVVGATVTLGNQTATTDNNGYYSISNVAPGKYSVTIQKSGYVTNTASVTVDTDKFSSDSASLAALDASKLTISGTAVNSVTGAPVKGADVVVEAYNNTTKTWSTVANVKTDATTGEFTVNQTNANGKLAFGGTYRVTVSNTYNADSTGTTYPNLNGAYVQAQQVVTLKTDSETNTLSGFSLSPVQAETISGKVTDPSGKVEAGATVQLLDQDGKTVLDTAKADDSGVYTFSNLTLPSGKYFLQIDDSKNAVSTTAVNVTAGTNVTENIQMQSGYAATFKLGTFAVSDSFPADEYTATVVDANGAVVATDKVTETKAANPVVFNFSRIPTGTYTVKVSGQYIQSGSYPLTVSSTGTNEGEGRTTTAGAATVTVKSSSVALKDATVNLVDANGKTVATGNSDASGQYTFDSVTPGTYNVVVSDNDYVTSETNPVTIAEGKTESVAVALTHVATTADVSGYIRQTGSLAPVSSATVSLYAVSVGNDAVGTPELKSPVKTDASGFYSISGLQPGVYTVVVRDASHETYSTVITVAAGDKLTNTNYQLAPGANASLQVTVNTADNKQVTPEVTLTDAFGQTYAVTSGTKFEKLPAGQYTLDVTAKGYDESKTTVVVGQGASTQDTVTLTPTATPSKVNVVVYDANDSAVSGATVAVFDASGKYVTSAQTVGGKVAIPLNDGQYTLEIINNGYTVQTASVTVAGQAVNVPVVQLSAY